MKSEREIALQKVVEEEEIDGVQENIPTKKKRMNIVIFTLLMIVIFLFVTEIIIYGYGAEFIYDAVVNYPQGKLVISETILALMVLVVMLLFKNSYVFTQKKEPLKTGLTYGRFYLIGVVMFSFLFGIGLIGNVSLHALFNVLVGALLVGVCEEFLCRGWLLNEFLERYGDTKKGVWYSIIISGIIFGLIHLGNFFAGQDLVSTITQILNASATGIVLGLIYYKTKNIWSVIILHGLWDFSLFLSDLSPVTSVNEVFNSFSILGIVFSVVMILCQLSVVIPHLKDIDGIPDSKKIKKYSRNGFILYLVFLVLGGQAGTKIGDEYKYDVIELDSFAVTKDNYLNYNLSYKKEIKSEIMDEFGNVTMLVNYETVELNYYSKNSKIVLENKNTKEIVEIDCEKIIDFNVLETDKYFILAYEDYQGKSNSFLYYVYINKEQLSNEKGYLEKVKKEFKKFLLPERLELLIISDYDNNKKYLAAYDADYGYFLLTEENKMAILK